MSATNRKARASQSQLEERARKRATDQACLELLSDSQMLKLVLDHMPAFVFWKNRQSVYLGCNRLFAHNAGLNSPEEIVGLTDLDLPWRHAEAQSYIADDQRVMETGVAKLNYEETQLTADHGLTVVRTSKVPLRNAQGEVIGVLGTFEDITERKLAQQRLAEAEAKYRCLVEESLVGVYLIQQGRFVYANSCMASIFGYGPQEIIGLPVEQAVIPQDRALVLDNVRKRLSGEVRSLQYGFHGLRKDGEIIEVEVLGTGTRFQGQPAVIGSLLDVTERKHAEAALRRLNRELRAISQCNEMLLRATDETELLDEFCRIISQEAGYRLAWVGYVEQDAAQTIRPVAWGGAEQGYLGQARFTWAETERGLTPAGTVVRTGQTSYVQDLTTATTQPIPWREPALQRGFRSAIVLPLKDEQARTFGVLTLYSEATGAFTAHEIRLLEELAGDLAFGLTALRIRAERARAEQHLALLSFSLNNVREAAFLIDEQARFHFVNEEACRMLGYSRAELLALTVPDVDPQFPAERWPSHWAELKQRRSMSIESQLRTKEGGGLLVEINANYFEYGGTAYNLALVRDITERERGRQELLRLNQELEQRVRERTQALERRNQELHQSQQALLGVVANLNEKSAALQAANKELESFSYSVSHDLRAPLRAIDSFSELLQLRASQSLEPQGRRFLEQVRTNARRMNQLIEDVLKLSRVSRVELRRQPVNLSLLVEEIAQDLARREPDRQVVWSIQPEVMAAGDPAFLRIALENLLSNAWKFTAQRPEARIDFGVTPQAGQPAYFVRDNGAGFDMQCASRLFGAFQRLHSNDQFPGTGIGLATVERIIRRHGGRVWAEGKVEEGATFYFTLA